MGLNISSEEQKQIALIILRAVSEHQIGKNKLAAFLRGSHSQLVLEPGLDRKAGYGAILWHDIPTIFGFITQLEEKGFLKRYRVQTGDYSYPVLTLSEAGRKVMEEKAGIPLQIRKEVKPVTIGESEKETLALFRNGLPPQEIARRRSLAVSTIFMHFYKLITVGEISAEQCISDEVIKRVLEAKQSLPNTESLKELKQILPEEITYEEIRIVLADKSINCGHSDNEDSSNEKR